MGFIEFLKETKEVWRIQMDKRRQQKEKYRIEYAFTCGGVKYYQYADIRNIPYERGLTALDVYNEVDMRCDHKFLKNYSEAIDKLLHCQDGIDIYKINALNNVLKQRLEMVTDVDLLYKLASVVYFDKTENPLTFEPEYAKKKIEKWKKSQKTTAFFLQKPLLELMPFLQNVNTDLDAYSKVNHDINELHTSMLHIVNSIKE